MIAFDCARRRRTRMLSHICVVNADGTGLRHAQPTSRTPGSRTISPGRPTARGSPSTAGTTDPATADDDRPTDRRGVGIDGGPVIDARADAGLRWRPRSSWSPDGTRPCCRLADGRCFDVTTGSGAGPTARDRRRDRDARQLDWRVGGDADWQRLAPSGTVGADRPLAGQGRTPGGRARGSGVGGLVAGRGFEPLTFGL